MIPILQHQHFLVILTQLQTLIGMLKIITKIIRLQYSIKTNSQEVQLSKQQQLQKLAQTVKLKLQPSIFTNDEQPALHKLTPQNKQELGLYMPKAPFNPRLTKQQEKQYLPTLTHYLYLQQKEHLTTYLRILQSNLLLKDKAVTLDHYINLIYKDIYARYLISKGIGIEWNGFYSDTGVLNEYATDQYEKEANNQEHYSILLDFIQNQCPNIKITATIGLYDYHSKQFQHPSKVEIEKIKKMGYYIKEELTSFGKFKEQFETLQEKNSKVYLMIFVEHLQKLIQPNAISIKEDDMFFILKKFITAQQLRTQYLMVSKDIYNKHEKYFKDLQYQKHSNFNAKHLLGMTAKNLPIISEIEDYQRQPAAYIVNSACHLADFERATYHNISHNQDPVNNLGNIVIEGKDTQLHINDPKTNKQLQQVLKNQGYHFMDVYDIFDDEVYYNQQSKRLLKFRLGQKYYIDIPNNTTSLILESLKKEGTILSESKIDIPKMEPGKKPKERRERRKERKILMKQITEHYSLEESLASVSSINISSLSPSLFESYLFVKNGAVVPYEDVLSPEELSKLGQTSIESDTLQRLKSIGCNPVKININDHLLSSLLYLKNLTTSKQVHNIIIEPQSETQDLIPYSLHLNYLINKGKFSRRKIQTMVKSNIKLIKLHPTFQEDKKYIEVKNLLDGVIKSNQQQQYGLGFEALRLWTAKHDNYLGDRTISQTQINEQIAHISSIRKTFWELLSLLPEKITTLTPTLYISRFILNSIDCYIYHMEECYKHMNLHKAYELTIDFFQNIIEQIYVKSIRKRIIAFPNLEENEQHFFIIRRIMELVAVITPLFPFSSFHISKNNLLQWPQLSDPLFYQSLPLHNEMIKLRVNVVNKLRLNSLEHTELFIPTLKQQFSQRDLELFFNIDKVSIKEPKQYQRQCSLRLSKHNSLTPQQKIIFYINDDHCIRCDPHSKQKEHLCSNCHQYLQEQIGQPYKYFPNPNNKRTDMI